MQPVHCSPAVSSHTMSSCATNDAADSVQHSVVAADQYRAVVSRLHAQTRLTEQLQRQLVDAHKHVQHLQQQLQTLQTNSSNNNNNNNNNNNCSTQQQQLQQHQHQHQQQLAQQASAQAPPQEVAPPRVQAHARRHDKEALSLCSDVSARGEDAKTSCSSGKKGSSRRKICKKARSAGCGGAQKGVKIAGQSRYWTPDEHKLFLEALTLYGYKNLRSISAHVRTRNMTQVRTHSQKYFMRLMREAKRQNPSMGDTAVVGARADNGNSNGKSLSDDKYSVPNTCGMTLLCLVGQDTLPT